MGNWARLGTRRFPIGSGAGRPHSCRMTCHSALPPAPGRPYGAGPPSAVSSAALARQSARPAAVTQWWTGLRPPAKWRVIVNGTTVFSAIMPWWPVATIFAPAAVNGCGFASSTNISVSDPCAVSPPVSAVVAAPRPVPSGSILPRCWRPCWQGRWKDEPRFSADTGHPQRDSSRSA